MDIKISKNKILNEKRKLNSYLKTITDQQRSINLLKRKINYLQSPMRVLEMTEFIQNEYAILLNPPSVIVKGSDGRMSEEYKIKPTNIICITSSDISKIKEIHLNKAVKNRKGDPKTTKLIKINKEKTIPIISNEIESAQVYLANVSQSASVNVDFYELEKGYVVLKLKDCKVKSCYNIKISKAYIAEFQAKKEALEKIRIFHKTDFSSVLNF
jgi:hypothetical protein